MKYILMFISGLLLLGVTTAAVYYGAVILNEWTYGIKAVVLVIFIILIAAGAAAAANLLTFKKLRGWASPIWFLFLLGLTGVGNLRYESLRDTGMESAAKELGLEYVGSVAVDSALSRSPIFRTGLFNSASRALVGDYNGVNIKMFTYSYETDGGDAGPDSYYRTVVIFADSQRVIPEFHMRPQGLGDALFGSWLDDEEDLDFPEDPEFSKRYYLIGPDAQAIRGFFTPTVRKSFVDSEPDWSVASVNNRVAMYADNGRMDQEVKPNLEEIQSYLEQTWAMYQPLRAGVGSNH